MFIGCGRDNLVVINAWKVLLCYFLGRLLDDSSSAQLQHHHSASTYACQSLLGATEVVDT